MSEMLAPTLPWARCFMVVSIAGFLCFNIDSRGGELRVLSARWDEVLLQIVMLVAVLSVVAVVFFDGVAKNLLAGVLGAVWSALTAGTMYPNEAAPGLGSWAALVLVVISLALALRVIRMLWPFATWQSVASSRLFTRQQPYLIVDTAPAVSASRTDPWQRHSASV